MATLTGDAVDPWGFESNVVLDRTEEITNFLGQQYIFQQATSVIFYYFLHHQSVNRLALGPTQTPIQLVPQALSPGIQYLWSEA
jgi:hypothetical protein